MTRADARRLAADVALSAVQEHAILILMSRPGSTAGEDWPKITRELAWIEQRLAKEAGYNEARPKAAGRGGGAP